jgi:hypothetical protein
MSDPNVVMSTVQKEVEEDEVTRFLNGIYLRLTYLLIASEKKHQSHQDRANHIIEELISDRCHPGPKQN